MKRFFKIIYRNSYFYSVNSLLFIVPIALLCFSSQSQSFIWLNQTHTKLFTFIFELTTFLGDGLFIIAFSLVLLLFPKKYKKLSVIILLSYISSGLFCQILKNLTHLPRPLTYFQLQNSQYYIDTFANSRIGYTSFPSGHTASFFAFATVIATFYKQKSVCIAMIIMSFMVGFSRIYLGHHFLIDVVFGAIIGIVFGTISKVWTRQIIKGFILAQKLKKQKKRLTATFRNPSMGT